MRLHVLSDLHLEFGPCDFPTIDADCVIFAGDIDLKYKGLQWINHVCPQIPVIYVLGNHEFYGARFPALITKLQHRAADTNVHILENQHVEIAGKRFFGCTLWTDMELYGDVAVSSRIARQMNDYKRIRHSSLYRRLQPQDTRMHHSQSVFRLRNFLQSGDPRQSVIITHHAPSPRSLSDEETTTLIGCAYASRLESLIQEFSPLVWIHGHIHHSQRYMIGNTLVVSNPRGYIDEANPDFIPGYVLEI